MLVEYQEKLANNKSIYLQIKVLPQAGKTEFLELMADGALKISVKATPVKGEANQELLKFLARELKIPIGNLKIINGAGSRLKLIKATR